MTKLIETMKSSDQAENEIDIIGVVVEVTNGGRLVFDYFAVFLLFIFTMNFLFNFRVDTMQLSDLSAQFACVKFWNGLTVALI